MCSILLQYAFTVGQDSFGFFHMTWSPWLLWLQRSLNLLMRLIMDGWRCNWWDKLHQQSGDTGPWVWSCNLMTLLSLLRPHVFVSFGSGVCIISHMFRFSCSHYDSHVASFWPRKVFLEWAAVPWHWPGKVRCYPMLSFHPFFFTSSIIL